jgi:trans-aconitate 2-methyltransferase
MVRLARDPLGDRAEVWQQDVLDLDLGKAIEAIVSTAALHWVTHHDRLWVRLARALRPGGRLEVQCAGQGNIARVRDLIATVAGVAPELVGWPPWVFGGPHDTERRLRHARFTAPRCWLQERPTYPQAWTGACARRSSQHISRASPRHGANASPPRSWCGYACRWTTFD